MINPKVSVVVATYRRDEALKRALDSLLEQDFKETEVVIVDDNDEPEWNEKVLKIVEGFRARTKLEIKLLVNHPNMGSAKARNKGIETCKGEYITFLDDDDVYLPQKIKRQYEAMAEKEADYSITDLCLYNEDDSFCEYRSRDYLENYDEKKLFVFHLKYHMTGTDTMMFKREYLLKIGGFDAIDVGDEFYLMLKAIKNNGKFIYVPRCDVKAYVHSELPGLSNGQGKIDGENELYSFKQQFFSELQRKDIRYIRMRHYAVLAFAYYRMRAYWRFFSCGTKSFLASPTSCLMMLLCSKRDRR